MPCTIVMFEHNKITNQMAGIRSEKEELLRFSELKKIIQEKINNGISLSDSEIHEWKSLKEKYDGKATQEDK